MTATATKPKKAKPQAAAKAAKTPKQEADVNVNVEELLASMGREGTLEDQIRVHEKQIEDLRKTLKAEKEIKEGKLSELRRLVWGRKHPEAHPLGTRKERARKRVLADPASRLARIDQAGASVQDQRLGECRMSTQEKRMPLARARQLADCLVADLRPGCERIEIAGSIRRRRPEVGDIEIVAIPKRSADLLGGEADSLLDPILDRLCRKRQLQRIKGGDKYKQFHVPDADYKADGVGSFQCKLDLFLCCPETWGVIFTIRTGSATFSHSLVTRKNIGGLLPSHLAVREGRIWDSAGVALATPEEADVFKAAGISWREPWERE